MKVEINNMMGVASADVPLEPGTIQAVLGSNMSGKTSLAYALGAILARNINPLDLAATKTNDYLRDGAETGSVVLADGDEELVRWEVKGSELIVAAAAKEMACTAAAAGLVDFSTLKGENGIAMWEDLFLPSTAVLLKRAEKELKDHLNKDELAGVMETIKTRGWESVDTIYKDRARRAKTAWKAVTGKNYGVRVAADWHPEGWLAAYDGLTVEDCTERLRSAQDALTGLHVARAITQAEIDEARKAQDRIDALNTALEGLQKETAAARAEYEEANKNAQAKKSKGSELKAELKAHREKKPVVKGDPLKCPCCDAEVLWTGTGELVARDRDAEERALHEWTKKEQELKNECENQLALFHAAQKPAVEAEEKRNQARTAESNALHEISMLREKAQLADSTATEDRTDQINAKNREIEDLRTQRELVDKRLQAKGHHESVQAYEMIVKILGPKGIRAKAMETAMDNVDGLLSFMAQRTGWPRVQVDRNYNVSIGKRASLRMCSESERWRGQAMLQIAIARMKQDPVIVLDRTDILDPKGREDLATLSSFLVEPDRKHRPCIVLCSTAGRAEGARAWLSDVEGVNETWLGEAA